MVLPFHPYHQKKPKKPERSEFKPQLYLMSDEHLWQSFSKLLFLFVAPTSKALQFQEDEEQAG